MTEHYENSTIIKPGDVKKVGIVSTGLIGCNWAAHFLAQGLDVIATDPDPEAEGKLKDAIKRAWPSLQQLGLAENASTNRMTFTPSIDSHFEDVDFVQESGPENTAIKDGVINAVSKIIRPHVVIASSTSFITPSRLQEQCVNPERMIVGHPFNPVHLMPLVEVVGGKQTTPDVIQWAINFYRHIRKTPVHCRVETPGHLANRLIDAIGAEYTQLIIDGIASPDELDVIISSGSGMRWALMGPGILAQMAAREGVRAVMGGKMGTGYSSYFKAEPLDQKMVEEVAQNIEARAGNRSLEEMEQMRDEFLVGLLKLRAEIAEKYGFDESSYDHRENQLTRNNV